MEEKKVVNVYLSIGEAGHEEEKLEEVVKTRGILEKYQKNWNVLVPFNWVTGFEVKEAHANLQLPMTFEKKLSRWGVDSLWVESMQARIRGMMLCDMMVMSEDWRESKCCRVEKAIAEELGMEVMEWHDDKLHYMVDDE